MSCIQRGVSLGKSRRKGTLKKYSQSRNPEIQTFLSLLVSPEILKVCMSPQVRRRIETKAALPNFTPPEFHSNVVSFSPKITPYPPVTTTLFLEESYDRFPAALCPMYYEEHPHGGLYTITAHSSPPPKYLINPPTRPCDVDSHILGKSCTIVPSLDYNGDLLPYLARL